MIRFFAVDGNTVGLGSLSAALVAALGYMLRDRRDSDTRVDRANTIIIDTIKAERDRAIRDRDADRVAHEREEHSLRSRIDVLVDERDELRERIRIQQLRLGLRGDE